MLVDQIRDTMTAAMKQRDDLMVSTLRMTLAAVKAAEVSGKAARALSDEEVLAVIAKEAKKRLESAEAFKAAGRSELEAKERAEAQILATYLPEALTPDELESIVAETMADGGFTAMNQMGQAMKAVNAKVAGRADGKTVSDLVKARLGS
jgi:uncharacterized protein YqeY